MNEASILKYLQFLRNSCCLRILAVFREKHIYEIEIFQLKRFVGWRIPERQ